MSLLGHLKFNVEFNEDEKKEGLLGENITINLFGKKLKFIADENVIDANRVAELLMGEVQEVQEMKSVSTGMDNFTKLTQAALNISNDLIELQDKYQKLLELVNTRSNYLKEAVEAEI